VASDAVYLAAGSSSGLAVGMKGALQAQDGRQAELEVLFVSAGRASCRVNPAGAELRVGDLVLFDLPRAPAEPVAAAPPVPAPLPPAAVAAIGRAAAARGPRLQGWWRADLAVSRNADGPGALSRQAVGLRAGLAQWKGLDLSLQVRRRSEWEPAALSEGWMDELAVSGPAPGSLKWEAGRLADGRNALAGPLDGLVLEHAGASPWTWGLSAGSRPGSADQLSDRALGAGGRIRFRDKDRPWSSDLKVRLEQDPDSGAGNAAGVSWSNQLRFLGSGGLENWYRVELREASNWKRAESRLSSTRLFWRGQAWQAEARHQINTWPARLPEDLQAGGPPLATRHSQQASLSLSGSVRGTWLQLALRGRGEKLDGDLERLAELGLARSWPERALNRVSLNGLLLLGPADSGEDLELRLAFSPRRLPELELGLRGWRLDLDGESWSGGNGSLFARGRLWASLRWEAGGLLQREDGAWERELRLGLRGELRLKPGKVGVR
jgi:hypothetical protein